MQLPVLLFRGSKDDRQQMYKKLNTKVKINEQIIVAPIVLTSYQVPLKDATFMGKFRWKYIIVDEGHVLKNTKSQISRYIKFNVFWS